MPKKIELPDILTTLETLTDDELISLQNAVNKQIDERKAAAALRLNTLNGGDKTQK